MIGGITAKKEGYGSISKGGNGLILHRTQPTVDAIVILNPLQLRILKAKSPKLPNTLTISWAVQALVQPAAGIARLGGYLEDRHKTPIGIQVVWRGWLKLHDFCEGWQLAKET